MYDWKRRLLEQRLLDGEEVGWMGICRFGLMSVLVVDVCGCLIVWNVVGVPVVVVVVVVVSREIPRGEDDGYLCFSSKHQAVAVSHE